MPSPEEIATRRAEIASWYDSEQYKCRIFEQGLVANFTQLLERESIKGVQFESRTKTPDSLVDKAAKVDGTGEFKYAAPKAEITDLVGVRVIVPSSTHLDAVADLVRLNYRVEQHEERGTGDDDNGVPGYRGLHFLVRMSDADRSAGQAATLPDLVAEVQVRTILQHAWASLQHDMMYKSVKTPSRAVARRLTALAGLLELADREFVEVRAEHQGKPSAPAVVPVAGKLTTSSLRSYVEALFDEDDPASHVWFVELHRIVALFGIDSIEGVVALLGPWVEHASTVRAYVRAAYPTANTAFAFNVMLRVVLGDAYLDARNRDSGLRADPDVTAAFQAENEAIRKVVGL